MSLKDRLLEDMKTSMKDKDTIRKNTVQLVRSAVLQVEKDNHVTLDDDGIIEVIAKEVKKRKDSLAAFEQSGRQDLIDDLNSEINVLLAYLPTQLTEAEVEQIVSKAITDTNATSARDIGKIMQIVMPQIKGRSDGKVVNQIIKKLLG